MKSATVFCSIVVFFIFKMIASKEIGRIPEMRSNIATLIKLYEKISLNQTDHRHRMQESFEQRVNHSHLVKQEIKIGLDKFFNFMGQAPEGVNSSSVCGVPEANNFTDHLRTYRKDIRLCQDLVKETYIAAERKAHRMSRQARILANALKGILLLANRLSPTADTSCFTEIVFIYDDKLQYLLKSSKNSVTSAWLNIQDARDQFEACVGEKSESFQSKVDTSLDIGQSCRLKLVENLHNASQNTTN